MPFVSYAQNFEDVMLWRALRDIKHGFYLDIGAADPVDMSVTRAFHDAGWRGVNVEPNRDYFERLRASRPADVNLDVAVGAAPGRRIFHEIPQTGLSTLDEAIAAGHRDAGWTVESRTVQLLTLAEICRDHAPADIHFLKIDVEGAEAEVLAGADFQTYRPWIVLLEATRPLTTIAALDWEPLILAADYMFVWFDGLNRFYVARERHAELRRHFELPPNCFDDFVKYDFAAETRLAARTADLEATNRRLTGDIASLQRDLAGARHDAALLEPLRPMLPLARVARKLTGALRGR